MFQKTPRTLRLICLAVMLSISHAGSFVFADEPPAVITDFSSDPLLQGWEVFGDSDLFTWDSTGQNLRVTWDSSRTNSYFRFPLSRLTTAEDNFALTLNLLLNDVQIGVRPQNPGAFQIAFGFQNRIHADQPGFIRGTGADTPNLVEFNFIPDSGFGATVWPAIFRTNGLLNYNGRDDFSIFELPLGVEMEITLAYTASNRTATLTITTNGALVGPVTDAPLADSSKNFFLDAFAISSYSDFGQNPFYPGSILAHGIVDNIRITPPPSPIRSTRGQFVSNGWEHAVLTLAGWNYVLEGTTDFSHWSQFSNALPGTGDWIKLTTSIPPSRYHFFRVKAVR